MMGWSGWPIPQNVSGDLKLTPITSKVCNWCSVVCVIMFIWVHIFCEYADVRPAVLDEDPWMAWFLRLTATLALAGFFYEFGFAITINLMDWEKVFQDDLVSRRRLRLNRKMVFVFMFLTTVYTLMATDIQVVHKGWIAEYYGGHQIVYTLRFIEWTICAPIVLSVPGQLDHAPDGSPRNGIIPSALLTGVYCSISWQGLVVKDIWVAWALIIWAFVSFFVASVEQLAFAWHIKDKGKSGKLKGAMIVYLVIVIGIYGVIYLLPIPGWISATFENKFYCIGDISFKILTSVSLLVSEDLAANNEMRIRALTVAEDLRSLIETAAVPIISMNDKGQITEWNAKAANLTGLPSDLAIGKNLIRMLGVGSQAEAEAVTRQVLAGETAGSLETTLNPSQVEGLDHKELRLNRVTLVLSITPRRNKAGHVKGVTLVGYDLTEVAAFREAETRKVNFMAIVSHELRSPLHGIIGLMEHLCEGEGDSGKLRFMKLVSNCANRLLDLVVNIMEMASMVSKNANSTTKPVKQLSRDPVELSKIIDEILVLVGRSTDKNRQSLLKKGVELVSEVKDLPIIEADAHQCSQVFYNIITNACKFTITGKIVVSGQVDPECNWVEVSVTDTGKGISRGSLERIFEPFEQEDNSLIRGYQGVGLGLSIAHEVVQRHGGFITVESEVDVGTTFTVRLPVVMADYTPEVVEEPVVQEPVGEMPSMDEKRAPNVQSEVSGAGPVSRPKILSVDDDPTNQEVIQSALGSKFDVDVVLGGEEALDYLKNCDKLPDLMLVDVMMPGVSGFDVCRYVREEMHLSPTQFPILMVSASSRTVSMVDALESGANNYVSKTFDRQVLVAYVEATLRMKDQFQREFDQAAGSATDELVNEGTDGGLRRRRA
eukprot:TRINITY_DN8100_c0_g2_i1.p1 TRINITY_DN8100_c0_g2~~TRINITY_DN8100_c0_g2_i1.p1  ORF type:complete len:884 (-),score=155.00 TRINITY_DN8100_c0_g2_i1:123-2774(-)